MVWNTDVCMSVIHPVCFGLYGWLMQLYVYVPNSLSYFPFIFMSHTANIYGRKLYREERFQLPHYMSFDTLLWHTEITGHVLLYIHPMFWTFSKGCKRKRIFIWEVRVLWDYEQLGAVWYLCVVLHHKSTTLPHTTKFLKIPCYHKPYKKNSVALFWDTLKTEALSAVGMNPIS